MIRLIIAVGEQLAASVQALLEERTAGTWGCQVEVHQLFADDKERNNGDIDNLARLHPTALLLVASSLSAASGLTARNCSTCSICFSAEGLIIALDTVLKKVTAHIIHVKIHNTEINCGRAASSIASVLLCWVKGVVSIF